MAIHGCTGDVEYRVWHDTKGIFKWEIYDNSGAKSSGLRFKILFYAYDKLVHKQYASSFDYLRSLTGSLMIKWAKNDTLTSL